MKKKFDGHANKGGVYRITNRNNGKIYIGSAKRFRERASGHASSLKNNKHQNKHLQASFNKHGADAFLFEVIEVVEGNKGERYVVEQQHIDQLIEENLWEQTFNFKKKSVQKERSSFSKTPEETRKKLSEAQKRLWKDPEERKKRIEGRDGKRREKIGKAAKRVWKQMSEKEKQIHLEKSLYKNPGWKKGSNHTKEDKEKMSRIAKERFKDSKNKQYLFDFGDKLAKSYFMITPTGESVVIRNMSKFCRENNLRKQNMLEVGNGKRKQYKGWKRQTHG